jgi:hypothetical protein
VHAVPSLSQAASSSLYRHTDGHTAPRSASRLAQRLSLTRRPAAGRACCWLWRARGRLKSSCQAGVTFLASARSNQPSHSAPVSLKPTHAATQGCIQSPRARPNLPPEARSKHLAFPHAKPFFWTLDRRAGSPSQDRVAPAHLSPRQAARDGLHHAPEYRHIIPENGFLPLKRVYSRSPLLTA